MAPKWQQGESSQSSKPLDKKWFVTEEASERFHTILAGNNLILERDLQPDATQMGQIDVMIAVRRWRESTKQPEAAVISIVIEFYANAKETEGFVV